MGRKVRAVMVLPESQSSHADPLCDEEPAGEQSGVGPCLQVFALLDLRARHQEDQSTVSPVEIDPVAAGFAIDLFNEAGVRIAGTERVRAYPTQRAILFGRWRAPRLKVGRYWMLVTVEDELGRRSGPHPTGWVHIRE